MRVEIDREGCIGCGLCESKCPQIFHLDSENLAETAESELPPELVECATEAAQSCPVSVIKLV